MGSPRVSSIGCHSHRQAGSGGERAGRRRTRENGSAEKELKKEKDSSRQTVGVFSKTIANFENEIKELKRADRASGEYLLNYDRNARKNFADLRSRLQRYEEAINRGIDGCDAIAKMTDSPVEVADLMAIKETLEQARKEQTNEDD
jgi:hypothetical protein